VKGVGRAKRSSTPCTAASRQAAATCSVRVSTRSASRAAMVAQVRAEFAPLLEDRGLEPELRALIARIRQRHYPLYGSHRD
ncbi:hypothetical protein, partial [Aeromonas dhakensis]|uniref:hypothetical protein n=1 Tax=Aeromonas dhakensis TaxID=196024 RepID=UPI001001AF46